MSSVSLFLFAAAIAIMIKPLPICASEEANEQLYFKRLKYEYQNRTFAYVSIKKASEVLKGEPAGEFFQAYYDLEALSQRIYRGYTSALNLDYQPDWFTLLRGRLAALAVTFITIRPESLISIIEPYIEKLEQLRALSDPRHKLFFDYIIDQEKVQLDAARVAKTQGWEQGARVLREFIENINVEGMSSAAHPGVDGM